MTLTNLPGSIRAIAFSPDGRTLAGSGNTPHIKLWNSSDWSERATLRGRRAAVQRLAFAPDGKSIASVSADRTVRLWSVQARYKPPEVAALPAELSRYWRTRSVSADGFSLAVPETNQIGFAVWDLATLKRLARYSLAPGQRFLTNWSSDALVARRTKPAVTNERVFVCLTVDSQRQHAQLDQRESPAQHRRPSEKQAE